MKNLSITERTVQDVIILDLSGNIRMGEDSIKLRNMLRDLAASGDKKVLLDLADVSNIDSSGLGELVAGYASVRKSGGDLKLLNLTDRVSELMVITKLLTVFEVFGDEKEALDSFGSGEKTADAAEQASVTGKADNAPL